MNLHSRMNDVRKSLKVGAGLMDKVMQRMVRGRSNVIPILLNFYLHCTALDALENLKQDTF